MKLPIEERSSREIKHAIIAWGVAFFLIGLFVGIAIGSLIIDKYITHAARN